MQPEFYENRVLIIVGPTGVGKTELSIRLAEKLDIEIVSADSRLLYRGMDIGTAKPTKEEMEKVPHHLIDQANADESWSLAIFQRALLNKIDEIHTRNHLPIVTGGTGQYIRSLIEGWVIPAMQPDPRLREILEKWGQEVGAIELHRKLSLVDPRAAQKIDTNNLRRTIRALEVIIGTGELFSIQKEKIPTTLDCKMIGLTRPRVELYARVDERIEKMFESGFVHEVQQLLDKGYSEDLPTLSAIGYREVIQYLHKEITLEETKVLMRRKTREFIRRQANWFKLTDPKIEWFEMIPDPLENIIQSVKVWYQSRQDD